MEGGTMGNGGGPTMMTAPAFDDTVKTNLVALFPAKYKMQGKMKEKDGSTRDMTNDEYIKMSTRSGAKYISAWETANKAPLSDAQKAAVYFATTILGAGNGKKFAEKYLKDPSKLGEEFEKFMKDIKIGEIGRGYTGSNFKLFVSNVVPGGNVGQAGSSKPKVKVPEESKSAQTGVSADGVTAEAAAKDVADAHALLNSYAGEGVISENGKGGYALSTDALPILREIEIEKNAMEMPRLVRALANPQSESKYILTTGDRLLSQIGRQMGAAEVAPAEMELGGSEAAPITSGKGTKLGIMLPEERAPYIGFSARKRREVARATPAQVKEEARDPVNSETGPIGGDDEVKLVSTALKASEVKTTDQLVQFVLQGKGKEVPVETINKWEEMMSGASEEQIATRAQRLSELSSREDMIASMNRVLKEYQETLKTIS